MEKNIKSVKEKLQDQLNKIKEQERKDLIAKHYPEFKKLEGKFFKMKNSYSCPEKPSDYWYQYTKVVSIKPDDVYDTNGNGVAARFSGWKFQTDKYGTVSIDKKAGSYIHLLGKEISENEFNTAWNKMIDGLDKLP